MLEAQQDVDDQLNKDPDRDTLGALFIGKVSVWNEESDDRTDVDEVERTEDYVLLFFPAPIGWTH